MHRGPITLFAARARADLVFDRAKRESGRGDDSDLHSNPAELAGSLRRTMFSFHIKSYPVGILDWLLARVIYNIMIEDT